MLTRWAPGGAGAPLLSGMLTEASTFGRRFSQIQDGHIPHLARPLALAGGQGGAWVCEGQAWADAGARMGGCPGWRPA